MKLLLTSAGMTKLGFQRVEIAMMVTPDGHNRLELSRFLSPSTVGELGLGVSLMFICEDAVAIYREVIGRGIQASRPFVGNGMWVTSLRDPDGYRVEFESTTDAPEETVLDEGTSELADDETA